MNVKKELLWIVAAAWCSWPISIRAAEQSGVDFFEKEVRPVLVEDCYKCHSARSDKVKGGLLLDTRSGWMKGGDSGPAIVPGDPEKSLLIKAVRYTDENLQMPPKNKKLSAAKISALEQWVKMGAPDPRTDPTPAAASTGATDKAKQHWAFRPIREPQLPAVKNRSRVQSPIDQFLLARLEARGLASSPRADRRTLIRRATYDLIGLPPTPEEVDAFIGDTSPDAFAKVVDRLLGSPHYGERWARYWLDVARYADTKGYVFEEERRYPFAYTYRDYVIRAFNEDLPYDRFIVEQLAADRLPLGDDKRPLAALGFLTLGRRFLNNQPDIIDDRIDVVSRGLMGLTVSCARCHDHKFDPIPTKDYYSIYGVFASSEEPADKPLLGSAALPKQYPEYLAEKNKRDAELKEFQRTKESELMARMRAQVGDFLLAAHDAAKLSDKGKQEALARERKLAPRIVQAWSDRLEAARKTSDPALAAWLAFANASGTNFAAEAQSAYAGVTASTNQTINPLIAGALSNAPVTLKDLAAAYNRVFAAVDKEWRELVSRTNQAAATALADRNAESLRQWLYAETSPFHLTSEEMYRLFDTPAQQKVRALRRKVEELDATHPGAPPRAMALADRSTPVEPVVFVRGNQRNPGARVPRQFLEVIAGPERKPFTKGSGRLEFAEGIASTNNPLTARVLVNRVWMYHFGAPLVRTPSDFGLRSDPPTHPELLDYLAARFMQDGWSLKKLHRLIMLSAAYQQSSDDVAANLKADPANDLLWRMNRRRLDFEATRDTLLAVAGNLDRTMNGHAVDITTQPFTTRRTVYAFIERQNLPGIFRTFDFASPDTTSPQRFATTVPQQALFLMNSPFVIDEARQFASRSEVKSLKDDTARVRRLYRLALQREPSADEVTLAREFVRSQAEVTNSVEPVIAWQYGFGEFDLSTGRVKRFEPLPHFTGSAWQGGAKLPDEKLGWVTLNAEGGHVGNDLRHAAIRRWQAPRDGTISIRSVVAHTSDKGDGVRARIVCAQSGLAGEWIIHNTNVTVNVPELRVRRGETVDFVADMRGEFSFDSFTWAPVLEYVAAAERGAAATERQWDAKLGFAGPANKGGKPLTPWEKYAQVLLLSNELMFVD